MRKIAPIFAFLFLIQSSWAQLQKGFFDFEYIESEGKIYLYVPQKLSSFIYASYLSAGLGSNDIGLDRGQINSTRLVSFKKYGNKLLLIHENTKYRAESQNALEKQSVAEAFAQSSLGAFPILDSSNGKYKIDISSFLIQDSHQVSKKLRNQKEGNFKFSKEQSVINSSRCKSFPKNTEFEAIVTFTGEATGKHLRSVLPSEESITLAVHHSFVALPDNQYTPRAFHPAAGYFPFQYKDYAVPIESDINRRFITRHRLIKKQPDQVKSEAVNPIIYYVDAGCPEPIKSALIEGALWWNEAFEKAGFINAFQVKELPKDADPLDIRYNMIQWVHRSTRGWSYGGSITDPRTGEIIKGHVSLGSLRVRQDYLIMQGLMSPFDSDFGPSSPNNPMKEIALARLRQISAHEVGHTLGLAHNFAASTNDRASVMDYPHPWVRFENDQLDFTEAYAVGIGEWDIQAIKYGYSYFQNDEADGLQWIIMENQDKGLRYITDMDARPSSGANASAHLWDNGKDILAELSNVYEVRNYALSRLGENSIPKGTPYSELEKVLTPIYLYHRYQIEAASKMIGGITYDYSVKGEGKAQVMEELDAVVQRRALELVLSSLSDDFLQYDQALIMPPVPGYGKTRESIDGNLGPMYDFHALASASAKHSLTLLLNPQKLNRIHRSTVFDQNSLTQYLNRILGSCKENKNLSLDFIRKELFYSLIMSAYHTDKLDSYAKSLILEFLMEKQKIEDALFQKQITWFLEGKKLQSLHQEISIPPGSPIGCNH